MSHPSRPRTKTAEDPFPFEARAVRLDRGVLPLVALLKHALWEAELTHGELAVLAERVTAWQVEEKRPLWHQGEAPAFVCWIVTGELEVVHGSQSTGETTVAVLGPGEVCGAISLLDREPRAATVFTTRRTKLVVMSCDAWDRLEKEDAYIAFKLLRRMARSFCRRLRSAGGKLACTMGRGPGVEMD